MNRLMNLFKENKLYVEIALASVLFVVALVTNLLMEFIIYMLYFIIFLEVIRAVLNYIREQRIVLTILIDAFIILTLREFIVNVVKVNKEDINSLDMLFSSAVNFNLLVLAGVIIFLLVVRYLSVKTSQRYLLNDKKEFENDDIN